MRRWDRAKALADVARRIDQRLPADVRLAIYEDVVAVKGIQLTVHADRRPDCRLVVTQLVKALKLENWNRFIVPELLFPSSGVVQWKVRRSSRFAMRLTEQGGTVTFDILGGLSHVEHR